MSKHAIVFGYWDTIKYSVHTLVGALEQYEDFKEVRVFLSSLDDVLNLVKSLIGKYDRIAYFQTLLTTDLPSIYGKLIQLNKHLKSLNIVTVGGGPHATGDPYGTILSLNFNYAFVGEAEDSLDELLNFLFYGGDPAKVQGLAWFEDGKMRLNGRGYVKELDRFPPFAPNHRLFNPIELTRGCVYACRYCQVSYAFSTTLRHRSVENVVKWSTYMFERGIKDLRFISPDVLSYGSLGKEVNLSKLLELLEGLSRIRERGARVYLGSFPSEVRPEKVSDDVANSLRKHVDNDRIVIGAQSGSDRLLKIIGRGHTSEDVLNSVEVLIKHGFKVDVDYIFGLPGETYEDIEATLNHITKVLRLGGRAHIHTFIPLPGTPYAFAEPGKIPPEVKKKLLKLIGEGKAYGNWIRQERLASEIKKLREAGVILITSKRAYDFLVSKGFQTT